jgi:hypothetical protein
LVLLNCCACCAFSGRGLFKVSGKNKQKKADNIHANENIINGVLNEPIVAFSTFICGAHTPPNLARATLIPTPVLRKGVGYNSDVYIIKVACAAPMEYFAIVFFKILIE